MPTEKLEFEDMQGIIARGYGNLPFARFLMLRLPDQVAHAKSWLASVTESVTPADQRPDTSAVHLAITATGLARLGLDDDVIAGFSHEFREGMTAPHRQRSLGDVGENEPANWEWGGPAREVHAALLLYSRDEATMEPLAHEQLNAATAAGLTVVANLDTSPVFDREPFGFRDGISQPFIEGFGKSGDADNTVRVGEFVLGYQNEYGFLTDSPVVPESASGAGVLAKADEGRDLGRNGSYLVFRQLEQDVVRFWTQLDELTRDPDGFANAEARTKLAAKMVGRWPNGASLVEAPYHDDLALSDTNDFGYHERDADGLRCPVGAHVRRANPRDTLDPNPGTSDSYELNKRHRLLRRGRPYGTSLGVEQVLAGEHGEGTRGIHFVCLSGNISRQFEFVQQTWLNNPKFAGLYEGVDPVTSAHGPEGTTFVVPDVPVRVRYKHLPSFVTVRGGAYFFLPGIRALKYLAASS